MHTPNPSPAGERPAEALLDVLVPEGFRDGSPPVTGTEIARALGLTTAAVWRWTRDGIFSPALGRKVLLPAWRQGRNVYTTRKKLEWFQSVTCQVKGPKPKPAPGDTPRRRAAAYRRAVRECEKLGV